MTALSPTTRNLVQLMSATPRGPKREGIFALWLTVRVIEDLNVEPSEPERALRRRVMLLEKRLSSLALPSPVRKGLNGTLLALKTINRPDAGDLYLGLASPVREGIGQEAAEVLTKAAKTARLR